MDDNGNLSLLLQTKLLSALQNRQIIRVRASTHRNVVIRLICATNRSLKEMVN
ncbi:MAG: sigma-54 factor interaction domain-containing protein [Chloroflexi bacterium]|nr:sigma-54 factor interaction domain-containing protein [Chloroflexota bacterium]